MTSRKSDVNRVDAAAVEAELTRDEAYPSGTVGQPANPSVPLSVRVSPQTADAIDSLARAMDVPASTLLRTWIKEGLAAHSEGSLESALDQLDADLQRLRGMAALTYQQPS
jgi:predicted transcriptional regulator